MKNKRDESFGVGPTQELSLRVSVAVLARVLFKHPKSGKWMLALERKATLVKGEDKEYVEVKAQPFGGAVRISDLQALQKRFGEFQFDSDRSRDERDFRIFIKPSNWPLLREFCIQHLIVDDDPVLENDPGRELTEEFEDSLKIKLNHDQFNSKPVDLIVEETPVPTKNTRARGHPTVRVYHLFETILTDPDLAKMVISESNRISDNELSEWVGRDAGSGGRGRANAILAIPLKQVVEDFLSLRLQDRNKSLIFDGHRLAETVPSILEGVEVPKYKRI